MLQEGPCCTNAGCGNSKADAQWVDGPAAFVMPEKLPNREWFYHEYQVAQLGGCVYCAHDLTNYSC
jgi:hypothetical protein